MRTDQYRDQRPDTPPDRQLLTVMCPTTREEFLWALRQGYVVAMSTAQRAEWDLSEHDDLPVLTPQEFLDVAFADPGSPVQERLDPSMEPDETWDPNDPSLPSEERMQAYLDEERRLDAVVSVRVTAGVRQEDAPPPSPSPQSEPTDEAPPAAQAV